MKWNKEQSGAGEKKYCEGEKHTHTHLLANDRTRSTYVATYNFCILAY